MYRHRYFKKHGFVISLLTLVFFTFQLGAADLYFTSGLDQLKKAEKAKKIQVDPSEINKLLSGAWENFKNSKDNLAVYFLIHTGLKMENREKELLDRVVPLIKQYRSSYIDTVANLPQISLDDKIQIKNYLTGIEEQIPFISEIRPGRESVFPLKGEKPDILFHLNHKSQFSWAVNNLAESVAELNEGENFIELETGNLQDYPRTIKLSLEAKNDIASDKAERAVTLNLLLPEPLQLVNGEYSLSNEPFRPESRVKKKVNMAIIAAGVVAGALLGLAVSTIEKDPETGEYYTDSEKKLNGWASFSAVSVLSFVFALVARKEYRVPDTFNIEFNKKLRERIEQLKKEMIVQVEMKESSGRPSSASSH